VVQYIVVVQYIGNTLGLKVTCLQVVCLCKKAGMDLWVWVYPKGATTKALRLIHNRPRAGPLRECLVQVRYVAAADAVPD